MNNEIKSSVMFSSNLQPVKERGILNDHQFLSYIRDPFALTELKRKITRFETDYRFSEIQNQESDYAAGHCAYAAKNDYPWGTVVRDGQEQVVCKCLNRDCSLFAQCRPDFDENELAVLAENEVLKNRMERDRIPGLFPVGFQKIEIEINENVLETIIQEELNSQEKLEGITDVLSKKPVSDIFESKVMKPQKATLINIIEKNSAAIPKPATVKEDTKKSQSLKTGEVSDFSSFVEVEQEAFIRADVCLRTVVNAGPGTGKTWSLIEKLIYMVEETDVDPEAVMVLCFSRAAVKVIEERLKKAADTGRIGCCWNQIEIRTLDSFVTYMIAWVMENQPELLKNNYSLSGQTYDERIQTARILLEKATDMFDNYEHIIVDEVQDLVGLRAEIVLQILRILPRNSGFSILGDTCQAIFDYQAQKDHSVMSSNAFYRQIFREYNNACFWEFTKCHRQQSEYTELIEPYRNSILLNKGENLNEMLEEISNQIPEIVIDSKKPNLDELEEMARCFSKDGTLAILTRTNGQALRISTWLKSQEIDHYLQNSTSNSGLLANWISDVFMEYEYDTINRDLFLETMQKVYPDLNTELAQEYWNALESTQSKNLSRYQTSDILKGVLERGRNHLLYSAGSGIANITVSTVHRVKGLEFDSVIMLDDLFDKEREKTLLEHKVAYVGMTRPRKRLYRVKTPTMYIHINRNEQRRCYQTEFCGYKKSYLKRIEFGKQKDLDFDFFASSVQLQSFLRNDFKSGMELKLKKIETEQSGYYNILLDDEMNPEIFGRTAFNFRHELTCVLREILGLSEYCDVYDRLYPDEFYELGVSDRITCISRDIKNKEGAKVFGDVCIWKGFSVTGFVQGYSNSY